MQTRLRTQSPLLSGLFCVWLGGCGAPPVEPVPVEVHALQGTGLGTTWSVKWTGSAAESDVEAAVVKALSEVDAAMSTWRDDSELAAIRATDGAVEVSWETVHVVRTALALAEDSQGAFDPTVQPLVELWGFRGEVPATVPTQAQIEEARSQTGFRKVQVTETTVDSGGTALDLSAIAKGWAVDRVALALAGEGLSDSLVEVGGETRAAGQGANGPWIVGIEAPSGAAPGSDFYTAVQPRDGAVATSGNYRNHVEIDGQRFGHTLDPREGRPSENEVRSATVIAPDCMHADGLATALMVLGEEGLALIEARPGTEALLLVEVDGELQERASAGFAPFRVD